MNQISEEIVEQTWKKMAAMKPDDCVSLIGEMQNDQPGILGYLMGVGNDILNQDEREVLVYAGVVIWQIMKQGDTPLKTVDIDDIEKAEDSNIDFVDKLKDATEGDMMIAAQDLMTDYPQPAVLRWIMDVLMLSVEEPEEGEDIRDENVGIMTIFLKTIIDCLNQ